MVAKKNLDDESDDPARLTGQGGKFVSIAEALSKEATFNNFRMWLVGDTPLITHAWSEKARREMLEKQVKATKSAREKRNPEADYQSSLYEMGMAPNPHFDPKKRREDDPFTHEQIPIYGFPAMGVKNCILSAAHKDKGIARSLVTGALWLDAQMVRTRPALAGAICDMPLVRIWGDHPVMREDMVKVGAGLNKTASLSYRAQFTRWAVEVHGRYNADAMTNIQLAFLVKEAGVSFGLGEWRNEKKGMFGAFHLATTGEEKSWDDFKAGGPIPEGNVGQYESLHQQAAE
jgi:hypothetical protein